MQDLADNSWLTFGEAPTNNFSLTGTYIDGDETDIYTGNIRFNSDNVLSYIFDEMVAINNTSDVTMYIERYIWTLYTPEPPLSPNDDTIPSPNGDTIPGFSLFFLITAISLGIILIERKKKLTNSVKLK